MPSTEKQFGECENQTLVSKRLDELEAKFKEQNIDEISRTLEALEDFKNLLDHEIFNAIQNILLNIRSKLAEQLPNEPAEVINLDDHLPKKIFRFRMKKASRNTDIEISDSGKSNLRLVK